jgi:hypothetical protein
MAPFESIDVRDLRASQRSEAFGWISKFLNDGLTIV